MAHYPIARCRFSFAALLLVASCTTTSIGNDVAQPADQKGSATGSPPTATPEQIAQWIAQLDDNRYVVREEATSRLLETQGAGLDLLLAAANGQRPEPADRAVWILRRLSYTKNEGLRRQVLEHLAQLQNHPQAAQAANRALAEIRHNQAVVEIQRLGGRFVTSEQFPAHIVLRVELNDQWRGGDAGMAHFRNLIGAYQVVAIGAEITAKGASELQHVDQLREIMLYGTQVTPEDLPELQKLMPHVSLIDVRRGGLLGVGADPLDVTGAAVVATVQPGSAAEAAGIRVRDKIMKFQGEPVENFKGLTTMIGKHFAGDEVTINVLRGDQPLEFKLKLGEWQSLP
ncbi:MAG TPA: PDZ domain-containing protein [Lacipirellulaceae bacterium]|nr:PDZ domain-containing protein [Lacipirellulaceae bacterium]